MLEIIEDEGSIGGDGGADAHQLFNSRVHRVLTPVGQEPLRLDSRLQLPQQAELLFHGVHGHEGLVDFEQSVEALSFFPGQVFVVGEEEEARALESFVPEPVALPLKLAAEFIHRPVDEGGEVVMIENDGDAGEVFFDGPDVGVADVHGHGPEIGRPAGEGFEEGNDAFAAFSFGEVEDASAGEIDDDGHVNVAFADAEFINGDVTDVLETDVAVFALEGAAVDILDQVPSGPEEEGAGGDGGEFKQFEDQALEGAGIGETRSGEGEMGPGEGSAVAAFQPMHDQIEPGLMPADLGQAQGPNFAALVDSVRTLTYRTSGELASHLGVNPDLPRHKIGFTILDIFDSEGMIKHRGGHGLTPWFVDLPSILSCPPFFKISNLPLNRMNPIYQGRQNWGSVPPFR